MKVALYCRVSTDEQAINGYSIDAQLNELKEYAKLHKYTIVGEYLDEGYSGGLLERPALNNLLNDIKEDKIELVIFVKLDRWFRSVAHYYKIQEILEQHNVKWLATQEDYETLTSSGKFKVNIMLSVSQQFKDATSERISTVFDYKVRVKKEVISGSKIYGYDIVDKHYVINKEEANNIKLLFEYYASTGSLNKTCKWWINTVRDELFNTIRERLTNCKYNGKYYYKNVLYDDYIPKIIDDDLFNKVQSLLKINYKQYPSKAFKHIYLFSGLIYCGVCGNKMAGYPYRSGSKSYNCSRKEKHRCPNRKYINENKIINYVLANLPIKIEEYNHKITESDKTIIKDNSSKISSLKNKYNRITNLYIDGFINSNDARYKELPSIKKEIEILEYQNKQNKNDKKEIIVYDNNVINMYNKLDDEHKQLFFKNIIERIVVKDGEVIDLVLSTK